MVSGRNSTTVGDGRRGRRATSTLSQGRIRTRPRDQRQFERLLARLSPQDRRIMAALIARLADLEASGDKTGALDLIDEVETILSRD